MVALQLARFRQLSTLVADTQSGRAVWSGSGFHKQGKRGERSGRWNVTWAGEIGDLNQSVIS